MAKLWKLPVIYIIENNHTEWGLRLRGLATTDLYKRELRSISRVSGSMGWTCGPSSAGDKAVQWCRDRNVHYSQMLTTVYRPFHVGSGEIPQQGGVDKMRTEHDPIEQVRSRCSKWASRAKTR